MNTITRTLLLVWISAAATAQDLKLTAVEPGTGSLLFCIAPDQSSGVREEVHYVQAPATGGAPREFLRCASNVAVLHRVDSATVLVMSYQEPRGLFFIDLAEAKRRPVLEDAGTLPLFVVGDRIWFRETMRDGRFSRGDEKEDGEVATAPDGSFRLWTRDLLGQEKPRRVFGPPVSNYWRLGDDLMLVAAADEDADLWLIDLADASSRRVASRDPTWRITQVTAAISPGGKYLSIGVAPKDSFFDRRHLVVFEIETGRRHFELRDISTRVCPLSSQTPSLRHVWLDDRRIRFSESEYEEGEVGAGGERMPQHFRFVDVDIETGKRLGEKRYGKVGLTHTQPLPDGSLPPDPGELRREGLFDHRSGRVYWHGSEEPIANVLDEEGRHWGEIEFSPCGRFCAVRDRRPEKTALLLDGKTKTVRPVFEGWCYAMRWLPSP